MDDDTYFWSKHGRPSAEKDHIRNSIAELCLSHLKKEGTVMKTTHVKSQKDLKFRSDDDNDMHPYVMYSLNKKRRWEAEDAIGVDLLADAQQMNDGWKVLLLERVNLRSFIWPSWSYGFSPERYTDYFLIKNVHEFKDDASYKKSSVDSVYGQRFTHFLESNRKARKDSKNGEGSEELSNPVAAYNFLRAPENHVALLQKQFRSSNYGWDWPHSGYWKRIDRLKDNLLELRYGEFEDLDEDEVEDAGDVESTSDHEQKQKSEFYNLEDHLVDKFVIVKRRRRKNTC